MSVGLLLLTHSGIGSSLLGTAMSFIKESEFSTRVLTIEQDCDPEKLQQQVMDLIEELNSGKGVLVFTDLVGSTPSNIASSCMLNNAVRVVTGLNLSMLIKVLNYPQASLSELVTKAIEGGVEGVMKIEANN